MSGRFDSRNDESQPRKNPKHPVFFGRVLGFGAAIHGRAASASGAFERADRRVAMSERDRLLPTVDPGAPAPGGSTSTAADLADRRRQLTRSFFVKTAVSVSACALILALHAPLSSMRFGTGTASTDGDAGSGADGRLDATAQKLLAQEVVVAAAGVPEKQKYRGRYPSWWDDTPELPDAQPIFLHIPKTGGVSVEDMASKSGHVTGACVVHSFGDSALPYPLAPGFSMEPYHTPPRRFVPYSFTIVRSPYSRMISEFNWRALADPAKAADIKAGRWSFTCGEFQDFVRDRVAGVADSPLFRCLAATDLKESDYDACIESNPGETLTDSHALPQWLTAIHAERVFKYENFDAEVIPFLRRAGVVDPSQRVEKINSAGLVSETASQCWALVSEDVLDKFVELYAVDFKRLDYDPGELRKDAASAALGQETRDMSEAQKAIARRTPVQVTGAELADLLRADERAELAGPEEAADERRETESSSSTTDPSRSSSTPLEEAGTTAPTCVERDRLVALGHREKTPDGREVAWAPAAWAVAEGTLRRAVFDSQALAETFKSRTEFADAAESTDEMGGLGGEDGLVAVTRRAARGARWAAERAARNPLGEGSMERIEEAGRMVDAAAAAAMRLRGTALKAGSAAPQGLIDACAQLEEPATRLNRTMAQATAVRRRWEEMEKDADGEEVEPAVAESAASLSGMSPEEVDFAAALSKFKPSTAGLSGVVRA